MKVLVPIGLIIVAFALATGCSAPPESPLPASEAVMRPMVGPFTEVDSPAGEGAGQPHVAATPDGALLLSWTETEGGTSALKMAQLRGEGWHETRVIAERDDFFVNWADFPSVVASGDAVFAHWLQRSAPGTYNYDVIVSVSNDGGATWAEPFVVHDDGVKAEHGFASMIPLPDNRVGIAWLDGRAMAGGHDGGHGDMSLRYAVLAADGSKTGEIELDPRTCECCTTTLAATTSGTFVAWRDRSADEVRDISFARQAGDSWSEPAAVHEDGWHIEGCPVNGPQSDAAGDRVVVVWFTGARETGTVNASFSDDGGMTFAPPIVIASGDSTVGYVDTVFVSDERAFVVWMEDRPDRLELMGREISASGARSAPVAIASTTRGRTGFPRMATAGDEVLLAWNEKGDAPRIRTARATISR